jgi:acyl-[acyl-carrier-protein]-phospholipid O-acyltransferase / long-chain-fatty-acid--[acyl-carrier-protein] ligase
VNTPRSDEALLPAATARSNAPASAEPAVAAPIARPASVPTATRALRWIIWKLADLLTRWIYRIRIAGHEHLPSSGGALLVSNHPSLVDPFVIGAATGRFVRFMMHERNYRRPILGTMARLVNAIPVSPEQRPRDLIRSLRAAADAIHQGELVCIFAEGQVTRTGQMLPFRRGFERIMKGLEAPVIPVGLDGLWGSRFSFAPRRSLRPWRRRLRRPVSVSYGQPLPPTATPAEVRQAVQELTSDAWHHRKEHLRPLHRAFVRSARRHPFRFAMGDQRAPRVTYLNALARAICLARRLHPHWRGQDKVGILLPPSVGGALVNLAALLMGKAPVNLNYTASAEAMASSLRQCGITTVLSSQAFLTELKLDLPFPALPLEEIEAHPRTHERCVALAMSCLLPIRWLERALGRTQATGMDDLATISFSSGSTGDPKGVPLSHFNLAANIAQLAQVFHLTARDRVLGTLPCFHSFGFTATLALTGTLGLGVVYHPTPLDAETVGRLVREYQLTFLATTPMFLERYLRNCPAEDFGSLRIVVAGAEKLSDRLANAFEDKFGIRPLEGYGCTECAPAVAVSTPDFRAAGFLQMGAKRGKIGHPLPGVCIRIVDPLTHTTLPVNHPGLLLVRGPNLMRGYLNAPAQTAEVLRDGWYITGDIATLDEDGFLQITDRLIPFSRVGGRVVLHLDLEEKLHELIGSCQRSLVVSGVGGHRHGNQFVVFHCLDQPTLQNLWSKLPQLDLPKPWVPEKNQFFQLDALPLLSSGKLDLRHVCELALHRTLNQPAVARSAAGEPPLQPRTVTRSSPDIKPRVRPGPAAHPRPAVGGQVLDQ